MASTCDVDGQILSRRMQRFSLVAGLCVICAPPVSNMVGWSVHNKKARLVGRALPEIWHGNEGQISSPWPPLPMLICRPAQPLSGDGRAMSFTYNVLIPFRNSKSQSNQLECAFSDVLSTQMGMRMCNTTAAGVGQSSQHEAKPPHNVAVAPAVAGGSGSSPLHQHCEWCGEWVVKWLRPVGLCSVQCAEDLVADARERRPHAVAEAIQRRDILRAARGDLLAHPPRSSLEWAPWFVQWGDRL